MLILNINTNNFINTHKDMIMFSMLLNGFLWKINASIVPLEPENKKYYLFTKIDI